MAWQVVRQQPEAPLAPQVVAPTQQPAVFAATQDRPVPRPASVDAAPDRASLTRALQRELKRVGCYSGEINGVWTPSTRHAGEAFLALANAKLPVAEPDPVLLALVQGNRSTSCVTPCAQRRNSNGSCREAIVAGTPATDKIGAAAPPAAQPGTGFESPMGLNGPQSPEAEKAAVTGPADQKAPRARPQRRSASHAHNEDWRAKVWRNSGN
jgi:peptidoglycan hydrolase-like protein with peptidoglycan-binding domain